MVAYEKYYQAFQIGQKVFCSKRDAISVKSSVLEALQSEEGFKKMIGAQQSPAF